MNPIHLSAAFTALARLGRAAAPRQEQQAAPAVRRQLLEQLEARPRPLLSQAGPRQLSTIINACASLGAPGLLGPCAEAVVAHCGAIRSAQSGSLTLHGCAKGGHAVSQQQVQSLLGALLRPELLATADPQAVANTLWALGKLQQQGEQLQLRPGQLEQLLAALVVPLGQAMPQELANALWALAVLQQQGQQLQLQPGQTEQLLAALVAQLSRAKPQELANTLWACGQLRRLPAQLLAALEGLQRLQQLLPAMSPQELANSASACGQLGYASQQLPGALLEEAARCLQAGAGGSVSTQALANLAWSAAVADSQQHVGTALRLAAVCSQRWASMAAEELHQLWQVHLWLQDSREPQAAPAAAAAGQRALASVLAPAQLQQCRAAREAHLAAEAKASWLQRGVFAALQRLPAQLWQQPPALEQLTPDGAFSADVLATTTSGVRLALEVDGPSHFRAPDGGLTGPTRFRNRGLAARGFTVVSLHWQDWDGLAGDTARQQAHLLLLLERAGVVGGQAQPPVDRRRAATAPADAAAEARPPG